MSETNVNTAPAESSGQDVGEVVERIEHTINKIRPYIQQDGGDVQMVDFKDGVVTVRLLGACAGCFAIDSTLKDGIQAILLDEVPEVKEVQLDEQQPDYSGGYDTAGGGGYSWY